MSEEMMQPSPFECPAWFDGKKINETVFCEEFLRDYPMVTVNDAFFTVNGRVHDENRLKKVIYDRIKYYVTSGVAKKVTNLLDVMRMECCTAKLSLYGNADEEIQKVLQNSGRQTESVGKEK